MKIWGWKCENLGRAGSWNLGRASGWIWGGLESGAGWPDLEGAGRRWHLVRAGWSPNLVALSTIQLGSGAAALVSEGHLKWMGGRRSWMVAVLALQLTYSMVHWY